MSSGRKKLILAPWVPYNLHMRKHLILAFVALPFLGGALLSCSGHIANRNIAGADAFQSACMKQAKLKKVDPAICPAIRKDFFSTNEVAQDQSPSAFGAPALPIDHSAKIVVVEDPRYVAQLAYCYFQFRGWFDPKTMSPEALSVAASGFAILKEEMKGYAEWKDSNIGRDCDKKVRAYANNEIQDLTSIFQKYQALIAINPVASIEAGRNAENIRKEALLTVNHERIHVLQVLCRNLDQTATKMWNDLPAAKKQEMKQKFAAYDWSNPIVAARENLALKYETRPGEVLQLANCKYE